MSNPSDSKSSSFEVEFDAKELLNAKGEVYHIIPAEKCRVGIVSRRRLEGVQPTEAAFIRSGGGWLPGLFQEVL
jgi:hypothetical protein